MHPDLFFYMLLAGAALAVLDLVIGLVRWKSLVTFGIPGLFLKFSYQVPQEDPREVFAKICSERYRRLVKGFRFRQLDESTIAFKEGFNLLGITYTPLFRGIASVDVVNRVVEIRGLFYWWVLTFFGLFVVIFYEQSQDGPSTALDREFELTFWGMFLGIMGLLYMIQWSRFRRVGRDIMKLINGDSATS